MISVSFDRGAVRAMVNDASERLDAAAQPAASAGAKVLYDQVKRNVQTNVMSSTAGHWFHGTQFKVNGKKYWIEPATLAKSIYYVYSKDNSGAKKKVYHVGWNMQKAPYGFMVEFGTRKAPAHPFLNPAWSRRQDAEAAMEAKLFEVMNDS